MAKGGYQKQRLQQKKIHEKQKRRRARRKRMLLTWGAGILAAVLVATLAMALTGGEDEPSLATSGSPTPTPSDPANCTKAGEDTVGKKRFEAPPCMAIDVDKTYTATVRTSLGTIEVELLAKDAPQTVNNFVFLARQSFYDGSIFHRVIPDFGQDGTDMVQGGDAAKGDGTGDPGYSFGDENMIPFDKPGYLAMANSGPGSNGSQFFFLDGPVTHLNAAGTCPGPQGCHSVFGRVTAGIDVIDAIAHVKTDAANKPNEEVVVRSVRIEEA